MTGNEYQSLAMRTNDRKATDRMLENMLTCDMKYLLQQNLIAEDERHLDFGGIFNSCLGLSGEVGEFNDIIKNGFSMRNSLILTTQRKKLEIFVGILQCFANPSAGAWMKSCK